MANLREPTDAELQAIEDLMELEELGLDIEMLVAGDAETEQAVLQRIAQLEGDEAYDF